MARQKKDSHPLSIKMDTDTYTRLQEYCEKAGQPKTIAIERAVNMFIDDYNEKMEKIQQPKQYRENDEGTR